MRQLQALSAYLIGLNLFDVNDFDSWVDNPDLKSTSKQMGNGCIEICRHTYKAVFYIERFPHKRHDPALLYAHISSWLMENDTNRFDNSEATVAIDPVILDAETAEITIDIDFAESITAVEDVNGTILLNGKKWKLADADIWVAEQGDIVDVRD